MHSAVSGMYPCVVHTLVHFPYEPGNLIGQFVINTIKQTGMPGWCFLLHIYFSCRAVAVTGVQAALDKALARTLCVFCFFGG